MNWRTLAACEVVLDHEDEKRREDTKRIASMKMRGDLEVQMERNAQRRAMERESKQEWVKEISMATARNQQLDKLEAQQRKDKRLRDRAVFAQQAEEQRTARRVEKVCV